MEFLCDFDMERYPFDSQDCFAELEIANGGEFIELITGYSFSDQLKILPIAIVRHVIYYVKFL